jgi:hypothetical protein
MGYDGVNNAIDGFSEIELRLGYGEQPWKDEIHPRWYNPRPKVDINNGGKIVGVYGIIRDCLTPSIWI